MRNRKFLVLFVVVFFLLGGKASEASGNISFPLHVSSFVAANNSNQVASAIVAGGHLYSAYLNVGNVTGNLLTNSLNLSLGGFISVGNVLLGLVNVSSPSLYANIQGIAETLLGIQPNPQNQLPKHLAASTPIAVAKPTSSPSRPPIVYFSGITSADLEARLAALRADILNAGSLDLSAEFARVYDVIAHSNSSTGGGGGASINLSSISDTTISGASSFSGTTGVFSDSVSTANLAVTGTGTSTLTGDVIFDNGTLYIDSLNHRVGIGTTSPGDTLSVSGPILLASTTVPGNATDKLYNNFGSLYWNGSLIAGGAVGNWTSAGGNVYRLTGNVGIGSTSPYAPLSVVGQIVGAYFTGTTTATSTFGGNLAVLGTATSTMAGNLTVTGNINLNGALLQNDVPFLGSQWTTSGSNIYYNTGSIGIGSTTPFYALSVEGTTTAMSSRAGYFIGTTTATSTLSGDLATNLLNVTSSSASSTFANGIELTSGCFRMPSGICAGTGGGTVTSVSGSGGTTGLTLTGGAITTSGTLTLGGTLAVANGGTNATSFAANSIITSDSLGTALIATGTQLTVGNLLATTTATSQLWGNVGISSSTPWAQFAINPIAGQASNQFVIGSSTATNFIVNNAGFTGIGTTTPYAELSVNNIAGSPAFVIGSSTATSFIVNSLGYVGIGTTSPYSLFSINPNAITGPAFTIGSSSATWLTVSNGGNFAVGPNALYYDNTSGSTTISNLNAGSLLFDLNAGPQTFADIPITSASPINQPHSLSMSLGGTTTLTVYAESDGAGGIQNQRIGVGTSSPRFSIHTELTRPKFALFDTSAGTNLKGWTFSSQGGNFYIATSSDAYATTSASTLSITQSGLSGNVGIGTTSPWKTLSVTGTASFAGLTATGASDVQLCLSTTNEVTQGASCGVSSARFKHNIETLSSASGLAEVLELRSVSYILNGDASSTPRVGLIAEEVNAVDPRLVFYESDGVTPRGLKYQEFVPILVKAIQDLDLKITSLQVGTSTGAFGQSFVESVATKVKDLIESATDWVFAKLSATLAVFDRVETQTAAVTGGLEITDSATGQVYCVRITNGEWDKAPVACDESSDSDSATTTPEVLPPTSTTTPSTPDIASSTPDVSDTLGGDVGSSTPEITEVSPEPETAPPAETLPIEETAPPAEPPAESSEVVVTLPEETPPAADTTPPL